MSTERSRRITGISAAPGLALAKVVVIEEQDLTPAAHTVAVEDREKEWARLTDARAQVKGDLARLRDDTARRAGEGEAAIFDAHMLMADDPELADAARRFIFEDGLNAEKAFHDAGEQFAAMLESMDDEYLRERAVDVRDVTRQVVARLKGVSSARPGAADGGGPKIIVARELTPSDTARWSTGRVAAMVTETGGATSHVAILARSMGLPAVVGAEGCLEAARGAQWAAVDGDGGDVVFDPDPGTRRRWEEAIEERKRRDEELRRVLQLPSLTADGTAMELAANIGSPEDARRALDYLPDAAGLFRTEFLFLERSRPPAEGEQEKAYKEVLDIMGRRPVLFRTLDVGADKRLPFIDWEDEENPALGLRGLRLGLAREDLLKNQFKAILRAGAAHAAGPSGGGTDADTAGDGAGSLAGEPPTTAKGHQLRIMVPMVVDLEEVERARRLLDKTAEELRQEGVDVPAREFGIMVETPAAALMARELASAVDFFSIGTNDLTQYTLAVDRVNPAVANLFEPYHPAVLRLIYIVGQAAREAGIWCGVCGESGGDPLLTPFFIGAGITELSMAPARLPRVKGVTRALRTDAAENLAAQVLKAPDARGVKDLLEEFAREALEHRR